MTEPTHYTPRETLREDRKYILCRAQGNDASAVLVLTQASGQAARSDLQALEHEYALRAELDPAWSAQPQAIIRPEGKVALVLSDPGGELLEQILKQTFDLTRYLRIAIGLAHALGKVHERGLVHKDIKPANILVALDSDRVFLTGFGIASRIPRQHQAAEPVEIISGTLAYMSPEQTGRMNRSIDLRSDLYSLGVTLYEIFAGTLPFSASDPMEWVHCHIARRPQPLIERNKSIPRQLSDIVMKLLSKTGEERYQSAAGVEFDLRRCLTQWETSERIDSFELASRDANGRLTIAEKLYGRARESRTLQQALQRVSVEGATELVLVSGYSGIGKSALVGELHKSIVAPQGIFIEGKFDQYKRDIPYETIAQAFRTLVRQILGKSEKEIQQWRSTIREAVGSNGQVIVDLIPELEHVIGKQPAVPQLAAREAGNRFHAVFRQFLGAFARAEHPLILFLDDLQWLDPASLKLLEDLLTHPEVLHLLLIGAYRDNEVSPAHPLMITLAAIRKTETPVHEIVLTPLSQQDIRQLVADALLHEPASILPLADLIFEKTAGNPFFTIQFLTALNDEQLIEFDQLTTSWRWDLERIRAKGFTDNVVDLMVSKLQKLPPITQETIKQLACLGNTAEARILAVVQNEDVETTDANLWEAVRAGLILSFDNKYKFLHDRVQEAAYSLIPVAQRPATHLRIGRLLIAHMNQAQINDCVFDVISQFNRGMALIEHQDEKQMLSSLNFLAGRKAKAAIAYASARTYLSHAIALQAPHAWQTRYEETFELYMTAAECEYLVGNFKQAAASFNLILQNAASDVDRARVYILRMRLYQLAGNYHQAVSVGLDALRLFGIVCPESGDALQAAIDAENRNIEINLAGRHIADLIDAPVATDPDMRSVIALLADAIPATHTSRPELFPLIVPMAINFSLRFGNTEESCLAYGAYGAILISVFGDIPRAHAFSELGLRLNEKFNDMKLRGPLLYTHGNFVNFWRRHFADNIPVMEQGFLACLEVGDLVWAGYIAYRTAWLVIDKGEALEEVLKVTRRFVAFASQNHNDTAYLTIRAQEQMVACLQGRTVAPTRFDEADFTESACMAGFEAAQHRSGIAIFYVLKQMATFINGCYAQALQASLDAESMLSETLSMPIEAAYYFYHAVSMTTLYAEIPAAQQAEFRGKLAVALGKMKLWSENCPQNFLNRYLLIQAEMARIDGQDMEAMRLYDQAIRSAAEQGFIHHEAIANELAAHFYLTRGFERIGYCYLQHARHGYMRWGATGKVKLLDQHYPILVEQSSDGASATFGAVAEQFDMMTVVKASQAVSGEIVLGRLVDTLLSFVVEHAGAERALFIRTYSESQVIEAEATTGDKISVLARQTPVTSADLPISVLHYVMRTHENVLLSNACASELFGEDEYVQRMRLKSMLCLPLVKQNELVGVLYLENNLIAHAFTADRIAVLELLASQAAISLENAELYRNLQQENAERRRTADALRESQQLLQSVVDNSNGVIHITDLEGRYLLVNRHYCNVLGLQPEDILGKTDFDLFAPDKAAIARNFDLRVLAAGRALSEEIRDPREGADGTFISNKFPLFDEAGKAYAVCGIFTDITDRKRAEEELKHHRDNLEELVKQRTIELMGAKEKAEVANRAKSTFLANMSHELRTPLNAVLGYAQILKRDSNLNNPQIAALNTIQQSGEHLLTLITDLLDLSKIEAGKFELYPTSVDLQSFVGVIADIIRVRAEQKGLRFFCELMPGLPAYVMLDEKRIRQVLLNLLGNAVKFSDSGQVILRLRGEQQPEHIELCFEVEDTGVGMEPAQLDKIFQPFEQVGEMQRRHGGTGLGLSISRQLVRLMGSDIEVSSQPGVGSLFRFSLRVPLGQETVAGVGPEQRIIGYHGERRTILIVDDVAANRAMLKDLLERLGFETFEADDGLRGIEQAQMRLPDAILMDLVMPGIDGLEATRRIRQIPSLQSTPIIAISANVLNSEQEASLAAGADAFLAKPVDQSRLVELMRLHLGLEWILEQASEQASAPAKDTEKLIAPPPHEMEILYKLAMQGNMRNIQQHANRIVELDAQYRSFAEKLQELAHSYQSKAILTLVQEHMNGNQTS